MKLRWDLVGVEKSPACVGGGALSCGAYSRKALRPPQQIKCGNAGVGSQCVDKKRPHRSGAKVYSNRSAEVGQVSIENRRNSNVAHMSFLWVVDPASHPVRHRQYSSVLLATTVPPFVRDS